MLDFSKSIYENRQKLGRPFLAAHRGVCGANIPCNTMAAYKIAVEQGAEVVEIDVTKTKDGEYFVFHPHMEPVFLKSRKYIANMTAEEVDKLFLYNSDGVVTHYKVPRLLEVLAFLKGKVYINVDKFWMNVKGISEAIRKAGVEKQVIVKTFTDEKSLKQVAKYAPDFMFMPMVCGKDEVTDRLLEKGVNIVGTEVLFSSESDEVISDGYIRAMHEKGLLVWTNTIVYNELANIAAGHTDDISLTVSPDLGWGWVLDKGIDFIQTDWLLSVRAYLKTRGLL